MHPAPTTEELLEIHGRIRACTSCRLCETRTQAVPGYGPVEARIMAVGEGPGEKEDREGRPFVGAAGKLLTELVESIGLTRRDLYITNVVKCRPPGNRDPESDEVQACSRFLDEQVALLRPDVILILGRHALNRLLPDSAGISRLHGERVIRDDRVYVPLYHPAAALYNGSLRDTLFADMRRVRTYLDEAATMRAEREAMTAHTMVDAAPVDQLSLFAL
ncbi:MAG: uracil-DNA glycosylase [Candidatus Dormibacteraeota bacterium]|nr:uracil-DNA glycosylase [Candidatus Dormibacteraeota bacterium]